MTAKGKKPLFIVAEPPRRKTEQEQAAWSRKYDRDRERRKRDVAYHRAVIRLAEALDDLMAFEYRSMHHGTCEELAIELQHELANIVCNGAIQATSAMARGAAELLDKRERGRQ
jgi:hypothetical protein